VEKVSAGSWRVDVFPDQRSPLPASSSRGAVHLAPGEMRFSHQAAVFQGVPAGTECVARFPDEGGRG
jgi:hypothetical protein